MAQVIVEPPLSKSPTQSSVVKSNRVCRHFARGRCTWGTACRFSHDADRVEQLPKLPNMGPQGHNSSTPTSPSATSPHMWIGAQQQQLQQQRNAILKAAIDGQFAVRPVIGADGQSRHMIHLTTIPSPEIAIQLLNEVSLKTQLQLLEQDERVREGGLHYLVGEPSVFWSMIRHFHQTGTTTSTKWDTLIQRARQLGRVDCMFFRSAAGCLSVGCAFDHVPKSVSSMSNTAVLSMATSNAVLGRVPSLGFGITVGSTEKLDSSTAVYTAGQSTFPNSGSSQDLSSIGATPSDHWMRPSLTDEDQLLKGIWSGLTVSEGPQPPRSNIW